MLNPDPQPPSFQTRVTPLNDCGVCEESAHMYGDRQTDRNTETYTDTNSHREIHTEGHREHQRYVVTHYKVGRRFKCDVFDWRLGMAAAITRQLHG